MKTREMAEQLVAGLIKARSEGGLVNAEVVVDAVEAFADQVIAEAWSRAAATIENATIGARFDDGA